MSDDVRVPPPVRTDTDVAEAGRMGAVAWGALLSAIGLAVVAVRLEVWRRELGRAAAAPVVDLAAAERDQRGEDVAFDGIVGALLLGDPGFADTAERVARRHEAGPAS
jgi:hypothetical protein